MVELNDPNGIIQFPQKEPDKATPLTPAESNKLEAMLKEISNGENGNIILPKEPTAITIGLDGSPLPTNVGINFANPDKTIPTSSFTTPPKDKISDVSIANTLGSELSADSNNKTR